MTRAFTVSDSVIIATDPATAYAQVSDPTLMGQSSPENRGASVIDAREGAYVGMRFDGHNRRGRVRWTTRCTVTAAEPGEHFAFRVHDRGTWPDVLVRAFDAVATGGHTFADFQQRNIRSTLSRLKQVLESSTPPA